MDEVIAATAYLDLFLRTIQEPALLKVFLKFILCARIDEMSLLDTLIQRIHYNTKVNIILDIQRRIGMFILSLVGFGIIRIILYVNKSEL